MSAQEPPDGDGEAAVHEPSQISLDLGELKRTALGVVRKREIVPQPLFWSLFLGRIQDIRKRKEKEKLLAALTSSD